MLQSKNVVRSIVSRRGRCSWQNPSSEAGLVEEQLCGVFSAALKNRLWVTGERWIWFRHVGYSVVQFEVQPRAGIFLWPVWDPSSWVLPVLGVQPLPAGLWPCPGTWGLCWPCSPSKAQQIIQQIIHSGEHSTVTFHAYFCFNCQLWSGEWLLVVQHQHRINGFILSEWKILLLNTQHISLAVANLTCWVL